MAPARLTAADGRALRFAHRGAWARSPTGPRENTLAAFAAAAGGWDGVELDVHRTADGHLVVVHDPVVAGLPVAFTTWADLHGAAPWLPTLGEALRLCRNARLRVNVEIKAGSDFYPGIEAAVLREIDSTGHAEDTIISSFDQPALRRVRELSPTIASAVLYTGRLVDPIGVARACGATGLHPEQSLLRGDDVAVMRAAGLWVATWTACGPQGVARLSALGVDGVIADPA